MNSVAAAIPTTVQRTFDNYANLKIGVRAAFAKKGLLEPQLPIFPMAETALTPTDEVTFVGDSPHLRGRARCPICDKAKAASAACCTATS